MGTTGTARCGETSDRGSDGRKKTVSVKAKSARLLPWIAQQVSWNALEKGNSPSTSFSTTLTTCCWLQNSTSVHQTFPRIPIGRLTNALLTVLTATGAADRLPRPQVVFAGIEKCSKAGVRTRRISSRDSRRLKARRSKVNIKDEPRTQSAKIPRRPQRPSDCYPSHWIAHRRVLHTGSQRTLRSNSIWGITMAWHQE